MDSKDILQDRRPFGIEDEITQLVSIGLIKFIDSLKIRLLSEVIYPDDYPPEWPIIGKATGYYKDSLYDLDFPFYVRNELFSDLYISYKQKEIPLTGRDHLERKICFYFNEYVQIFWFKVNEFSKNFRKLEKAFKQNKNREVKVMIIPQLTSPINISLSIRFALLHRAKHKCEGCGSSFSDNPIEVFMVNREDSSDDDIEFIVYCEKCRILNERKIIPEP